MGPDNCFQFHWLNMANLIRRTLEAVRPRMLPKLVIVGAQKVGTTTVFNMLTRHPKVLPPVRKELHFFDVEDQYGKGIRHYRSLFPTLPLRARRYITLEATPRYLFFSGICAPRIARHLPEATCLILLRDPVKRAYSAWNMNRTVQRRPGSLGVPDLRSFTQAVEDELAGKVQEEQHQYLARSSYADQVADYRRHFPPSRLLIYSFKSLKQNPAALINGICDHLGIPAMHPDDPALSIRSNHRTYVEPMDPGFERQLYAHFAPEMERLATVLGYMPDILEN